MARCLVAVGVPYNLEERKFTYKQGDKKGQEATVLGFRLRNAMTEVSGSVDFDASQEVHMSRVKAAADAGECLEIVVQPRCQRYERDGKIADFATMRVRGIAG